MTVFDNIAYGLRMHFKLSKSELSERVEDALSAAPSGKRSRTS